jgi:starch synthase
MQSLLYIASEAIPFCKTGGLGDVAASLPEALGEQGYDVRVLLPGYPGALQEARRGVAFELLQMELGGYQFSLVETVLPGSKVCHWLLDCPQLFDRPGNPYLDATGQPWADNHLRFALLCRLGVELAMNRAGLQWQPGIVHCNDWQTGLVPALLSLETAPPASVFTLHNLAYQGLFSYECFAELQLPQQLFSPNGLEFHGQLSFIKGGLLLADCINTVSPSYAVEIQTAELGYGLDGLLRYRSDVLSGILNGIDTGVWNPATDPLLVKNYDLGTLTAKRENKAALQRDYRLHQSPTRPLLGFVGRLVEQKGIDLILAAIPELVSAGAQFIILGSGETRLEQDLAQLAATYPGDVAVLAGYDETLSHQIEAGADIFIMPSRFEPCGLNQMYSLRYGTVPVVHRCGGLADTVVDCGPASLADGSANGFSFDHADVGGLLYAAHRALECYRDDERWQKLQARGMSQDWSWQRSARAYQQLYQHAQQIAMARQLKARAASD